MPATSGTLLEALGVSSEQRTWKDAEFGSVDLGDGKGVKLFERRRKEGDH
jgi:hypothetical protein